MLTMLLLLLLLLQVLASSALHDPLASLSSLKDRRSSKALNRTESQASALSNSSSQTVDSLARTLSSKEVGCFTQTEIHLVRPRYLDCINAAWKITVNEINPKASRYFSRVPGRPNHDFLLPDVFISGSCAIYVDVVSEAEYDIFSLMELQQVALELVDDCVKLRPHLGGDELAGPKQVTKMLIFGPPNHGIE